MHECLAKLLKDANEESLELLCCLITTGGQSLEQDTKERLQKGGEAFASHLRPIEFYFQEIFFIINEKKTGSRVRFLLQDCVDLRRNNWQKRREDAGHDKTVDQILEEAKKEEQLEKKRGSRRRGGGGGIDARDDPQKRSLKGGSGGGGGQEKDGWLPVPTFAAKITDKKVDTTRMRKIVSKLDSIGIIELGPPSAKAAGGFSKGSGGRVEKSLPAVIQNRFSAFSSSGGGGGESSARASNYEGRHEESVPAVMQNRFTPFNSSGLKSFKRSLKTSFLSFFTVMLYIIYYIIILVYRQI
jgi:hypothetical protein